MAVADTPVIPALAGVVEDFDWSLCRTFLAVARRGSIAAATGELGLSHPAVRRQLERFEEALGAPLFSRSPSGMVPTPLAVALFEPAEVMERSARSMLREASSTETSGLVRIAVDGLLAAEVLPLALQQMRRDHQGIRYQLVVPCDDPASAGADVLLHLAAPTRGRLVTSRIATFRTGFFASRSWVAANGSPPDWPALVATRALVGSAADFSHTVFGPAPPANALAVAVDGSDATMALIATGLGVGSLPIATGNRRDDLVRVLPEISVERGVWLSVHADLRNVPHVRQVLDALRQLVRTSPILVQVSAGT